MLGLLSVTGNSLVVASLSSELAFAANELRFGSVDGAICWLECVSIWDTEGVNMVGETGFPFVPNMPATDLTGAWLRSCSWLLCGAGWRTDGPAW